ncbi:hypothetical protein F4809DRAFT_445149 [Biscogniauxia mediterranea]|nr:hypothetical protein F4809DRAFT_445149 [Biscogniauxia mediterranea]
MKFGGLAMCPVVVFLFSVLYLYATTTTSFKSGQSDSAFTVQARPSTETLRMDTGRLSQGDQPQLRPNYKRLN